MRINVFIAQATGMSRRAADKAVNNGEISVNQLTAATGQQISPEDIITFKGKRLKLPSNATTIMLNKPAGYVCSRKGQGSRTVYELLPEQYAHLKPVGRLDKDSSGLLLLSSDGQLAHQLTHPSYQKEKIYEVTLDKELSATDKTAIEKGIKLEDGISKFNISFPKSSVLSPKSCTVTMYEGRNRQIRRTFEALGIQVTALHRIRFGSYELNGLKSGGFKQLAEDH